MRAERQVAVALLLGTLLLGILWLLTFAGETRTFTEVVLDGDPSDWAGYDIISDSRSDARGDVEITGLRVFTNDSYLYVLVEVDDSGIGEYAQLDVDINPGYGLPEFMANAKRGESILHLGRFEDGQRFDIPIVGELAVGAAFEMRFPLQAFGTSVPERVAVRVMGGTCCGPQWVTIDETSRARVVVVDQMEMPFLTRADLRCPDSAFCRCQEPADGFEKALHIRVPAGYRAEFFVAPSPLNCPSDVAVASDGTIYVASARNGRVLEISRSGSVSVYSEVYVYSIDVDARDQLYGYNMPTGEIYSITKNGHRRIARVQETACESTLAVAPDGTLYIGHNYCGGDIQGGQSTIYRIRSGGGNPEPLVEGLEFIFALDVDNNGNLYGASTDAILSIDPRTGSTRQVRGSTRMSFHGLIAADDGTIYFSTGDTAESGSIFRISPEGAVSEIAAFSGNGIQGIARTPDGGVVGVQRAIGGLQLVHPGGAVTTLVEPNGLTSPQSLAVSPCGDVLVVNDEAGWASVVCVDGTVRAFAKMCSYQPPQTGIAFSNQGWVVAGESAPGFASLLNVYLPNGRHTTLSTALGDVSGVAVAGDGTIFASVTREGRIVKVSSDGSMSAVADGLQWPQGLALTEDGALYVIVGGVEQGDVFVIPQTGDTIIQHSKDGSTQTVARLEGVAAVAVDPSGTLYAVAKDKVYRISGPWSVETFASGFSDARGLAFDAQGRLYVADDFENTIIRIVGAPAEEAPTETVKPGRGEIP